MARDKLDLARAPVRSKIMIHQRITVILLLSTATASFGPFDLSLLRLDNIKGPNIVQDMAEDTRYIGAGSVFSLPTMNIPSIATGYITNIPTVDTSVPTVNIPSSGVAVVGVKRPVSSVEVLSRNMVQTPKKNIVEAEILPEMTVQDVIDLEVSRCGFRKASRAAQFRKTLELIAENNHEAFFADEPNFMTEFSAHYHTYMRKEVDYYLFRFMLLFGADKHVNSEFRRVVMITETKHKVEESMRYLVHNQPFERLVDLFTGKMSLMSLDEDAKNRIKAVINEKYPKLSYFKKLFVNMIGKFRSFGNFKECFMENDDRLAFELFVKSLKTFHFVNREDLKIITTAILDHGQCFVDLEIPARFLGAEIFLWADDHDGLKDLITLSPEIILHTEANVTQFESRVSPRRNILTSAMQKRSLKCVRFLLEYFPELAAASSIVMTSGLETAVTENSFELMEILEEFGFGHDFVVESREAGPMTMLQLSIHSKSMFNLKRYVEKVGVEEAGKQIRAIWPVKTSILAEIDAVQYPRIVDYLLRHVYN